MLFPAKSARIKTVKLVFYMEKEGVQMANIKPLRGLRFNPEKVGDLAKVVSPPYDVISRETMENLYKNHANSIINLELGRQSGSPDDEIYRHAADIFHQWLENNIFLKDQKPAFYYYVQDFNVNNMPRTRTGFLCAMKAEGYQTGNVIPHEQTLPWHKSQRLKLLQYTRANFSPIFGVYHQESGRAEQILANAAATKGEPDIDLIDCLNERHRIWVIDDEVVINEIIKSLANLPIYIADGHHRYETASTFAEEALQKGETGCDYLLVSLSNCYNKGLYILPTHRIIEKCDEFSLERFLSQLEKDFTLSPIQGNSKEENLNTLITKMEETGKTTPAFGIYGGENHFYLLQLKNPDAINHYAPEHSAEWRKLDISILHGLVIEPYLHIGAEELASEGYVSYARNNYEPVETVDKGDGILALFVNTTQIQQMIDVANSGNKMPQKSTFFYPKLLSGLVIHQLED